MICQRYHVMPDVARAADISILRHIAILELANGEIPAEPPAPRPPTADLAAFSYSLAGGA